MSAGQLPPPGTVLRKYDRNGAVRCEAVVGQNGQVIYRGVTYSSISAAAKVAAGDIGLAARSCDGYAFFGLKGRADAAPRTPRSVSEPRSGSTAATATALPLPLPVRWDDLPPAPPSANRNEIAAVTCAPIAPALQHDGEAGHILVLATPPVSPIKTAAERATVADGIVFEEILLEAVFNHGKHGRADASGAPIDSDCACRGTTREKTCAESGCGFCRAAQSMARLTGSAPSSLYREPRSVLDEEVSQVRFPSDKTAVLSLAPDIDAPSSVDLRQRGAELVQSLDDPASAGARQALDFAYGNLACSTRHKPDRETFRRLWAERKLPAKEFDAWAASRTWWDRVSVDDPPLPERYGEPCVLHGKPVQYNIGDGLRCADCLPQELADKVPDEAEEIAPSAPSSEAADSASVSAIAATPTTLACNMIVGHKADFDRDKDGRVVGVEPGDEIECGKLAVKQIAGDPRTRLCAECAVVWEADRFGELEPIVPAEPAGATVADLAPIIDEQARAESAQADASTQGGITEKMAPPEPPAVIEPPAPEPPAPLGLIASTVDPRDFLGQRVREVWVAWAREVSAPKAPWLLPWAELAESYREVDRRVGEALFKMGADAEVFEDRISHTAMRRVFDELRGALLDAVDGNVDPDERMIDTLRRIVRERNDARTGKPTAELESLLLVLTLARNLRGARAFVARWAQPMTVLVADDVRERDAARASKRAEATPGETREPTFTLGEVMTILGNLGGDQVKCGACMEVAFTGATTSAHECAKRRRALGSITRHEPDEIEKILSRWASRAREDYNLSDEARAVLKACFKEMAEAYVGPDPTGVEETGQGPTSEAPSTETVSSAEDERRQGADIVASPSEDHHE